jgi:hypothetical protein
MGNILRGLCKCGYDTGDIFAGAGFANFMETCNAPALCTHCNEFLVRNYMLKNEATCPGCGDPVTFYDDPSLYDSDPKVFRGDYLFVWRIADRDEFFKLPDTNFFCPGCKKLTLVFEDMGRWD